MTPIYRANVIELLTFILVVLIFLQVIGAININV